MKQERNIYTCPYTQHELQCIPETVKGNEVITGILSGEKDITYPIRNGVPIFLKPEQLLQEQAATLDYYNDASKVYDDVAEITFRIQYLDEVKTRKKFLEPLSLAPNDRVLEIACGTGRDSINIAEELGKEGQYYLQDLCQPMLQRCQDKLRNASVPTEFLVGDACYLPFPDRYFDAIFSFGGLCVFGDIKKSIREMIRVSKLGARIAIGDESMAPWLYDTEYGKLLLANNPLFKAKLPLEYLPPEARDVRIQWVVSGAYFIIYFTVGEGEPKADFDFPIPGVRGGTLRTRYYGKLEGVTAETYALMEEARQKSGKSRHQWLEEVIRNAALQQDQEKERA